MSEAKQLPKRQEVPIELTWDLTKIFADDAAFEEKFQALSEELSEVDKIKGTLAQGATEFLTAIEYVFRYLSQGGGHLCICTSKKMMKILQIQQIKHYMHGLLA